MGGGRAAAACSPTGLSVAAAHAFKGHDGTAASARAAGSPRPPGVRVPPAQRRPRDRGRAPVPLQPPAAPPQPRPRRPAAPPPAERTSGRVVSASAAALARARDDRRASSSPTPARCAAARARGRGRARRDRPRLQPLPRRLRARRASTPRRAGRSRVGPLLLRGDRGRAARRRAHRRRGRPDRRRGAGRSPATTATSRVVDRRAGAAASPRACPAGARRGSIAARGTVRVPPRRAARPRRHGQGAGRRPRGRGGRAATGGAACWSTSAATSRWPARRRAGGWRVRVADDHRAAARRARARSLTIDSGGLATSSTTVRRWGADGATTSSTRATGRPAASRVAHRQRRRRDLRGRQHRQHRGDRAAATTRRRGSPSARLPARLVDRDGAVARRRRLARGARGRHDRRAHGPSALWYATRGAGAVTLVLLTASVVLGIARGARAGGRPARRASRSPRCTARVSLLARRAARRPRRRPRVLDPFPPHRRCSTRSSRSRPPTGRCGSGSARSPPTCCSRSSSRASSAAGSATAPGAGVHWLAYACWPVALLHGLGTGSDAKTDVDARAHARLRRRGAGRARRAAGGAGGRAAARARAGAARGRPWRGVALVRLAARRARSRAGWARRAGTPARRAGGLRAAAAAAARRPAAPRRDALRRPFTAALRGRDPTTARARDGTARRRPAHALDGGPRGRAADPPRRPGRCPAAACSMDRSAVDARARRRPRALPRARSSRSTDTALRALVGRPTAARCACTSSSRSSTASGRSTARPRGAPVAMSLPRLLAGTATRRAAVARRARARIHGPARAAARDLIEAVAQAGLRGRGGASFPTAVKLRSVARPPRTARACSSTPPRASR